jgi:hypothetical protein
VTVRAPILPPLAVPLDDRAPVLRLAGAKRQPAGRSLAVTVSCDEACAAVASGRLVVTLAGASAAKTRRFRLRGARATLAAAGSTTLRLRVPRAAGRAFAGGARRGVATIAVRVSDAAGNTARSTRRISVRRRAR